MENVEFNIRSKFGDLVHYVCIKQTSFGRITVGYLFTVYMYVNNVHKKTYNNILATSYTDLNKQINILYDNF